MLERNNFINGFSPQFFSPASNRSDALTITQCEDSISYTTEAYGTPQDFESSPDFIKFKEQFSHHLRELKQFANESFHDSANIVKSFSLLESRLFDANDTHYLGHKAILYGAGKRSLDQLVELIKNNDIPFDDRANAIRNLAEDAQLCAEGAVRHLAMAAGLLSFSLYGKELSRVKQVAIEQLIYAFVLKEMKAGNLDFTQAMEVHLVTAFCNALSGVFGLTKQEDNYAPQLWDSEIKACQQYVWQCLTPLHLASTMAEHHLSRIRSTLHEEFLRQGDGDSVTSFDYMKFQSHIDAALQPLQKNGIQINFHSIFTLDEMGERASLHSDSTLLILDILKYMRNNGILSSDFKKPKILAVSREKNFSIQYYNDETMWVKEGDEFSLLQLEHLKKIEPREIPRQFRKTVADKVLKEKMGQFWQKDIPLTWLVWMDVEKIFSDFCQENISNYLQRKHAVIENLTPKEQCAIARGVIAHGCVSDLAMCIKDPKVLFLKGKNDKHDESVFSPLHTASHRDDAEWIHVLGNMLLKAVESPTMLSISYYKQVLSKLVFWKKNRRNQSPSARIIFELNAVDKKGISLLNTMLSDGRNTAASSALIDIAIQAIEKKKITHNQFIRFLQASDSLGNTALTQAFKAGHYEQADAFLQKIFLAYKKNLLSVNDLKKLLNFKNNVGSVQKDRHAVVISVLGKVIQEAYQDGILNADEATSLLLGQGDKHSLLLDAMNNNDAGAVQAYGQVLLNAHEIGIVDAQQCTSIFENIYDEKNTILAIGLTAGRAEAVGAFLRVVVKANRVGFLTREKVFSIFSVGISSNMGDVWEMLGRQHNDAVSAFRREVLNANTNCLIVSR